MIPQWVRQVVFPRLDPLARRHLDKYLAYQLDEQEFLGTLEAADARAWLAEHGYESHGLSAAKRHPDDPDRIDRGSYRKVPDVHPDVSGYEHGGARLVAQWPPEACQYHVHLFDAGPGRVELFGHYELRPDLLGPSPSLERLRVHYRPTWHEDYLLGVASAAVDDGTGAG